MRQIPPAPEIVEHKNKIKTFLDELNFMINETKSLDLLRPVIRKILEECRKLKNFPYNIIYINNFMMRYENIHAGNTFYSNFLDYGKPLFDLLKNTPLDFHYGNQENEIVSVAFFKKSFQVYEQYHNYYYDERNKNKNIFIFKNFDFEKYINEGIIDSSISLKLDYAFGMMLKLYKTREQALARYKKRIITIYNSLLFILLKTNRPEKDIFYFIKTITEVYIKNDFFMLLDIVNILTNIVNDAKINNLKIITSFCFLLDKNLAKPSKDSYRGMIVMDQYRNELLQNLSFDDKMKLYSLQLNKSVLIMFVVYFGFNCTKSYKIFNEPNCSYSIIRTSDVSEIVSISIPCIRYLEKYVFIYSAFQTLKNYSNDPNVLKTDEQIKETKKCLDGLLKSFYIETNKHLLG